LTKKIPNEPQGDDESGNEVQTRVDVHAAGCEDKEHAQGSSSTVETETGEGSHADEPRSVFEVHTTMSLFAQIFRRIFFFLGHVQGSLIEQYIIELLLVIGNE